MAGIKINLRGAIRVKDKNREFGDIKGKASDGTAFSWQNPVLMTVNAALNQTTDIFVYPNQPVLRIDWGDGVIQNVGGPSIVYHTYPSSSGLYQIRVIGLTSGGFRLAPNIASSPSNLVSIDNYFSGGSTRLPDSRSTALTSLPSYLPVTVSSIAQCMRNSVANVTGPQNWNTSNVTNFSLAFESALGFNQNISSWNTSSVTDMSRMFDGASDFNQDLGSWNISNVTTLSAMFNSSGLSTENYSRTLIGWANSHFAGNAQDDVSLGAIGVTYNNTAYTTGNQFNDAASARAYLVGTAGWTITDGGQV